MKRREFVKLSGISLCGIIPFSGILEKLYGKLFPPKYDLYEPQKDYTEIAWKGNNDAGYFYCPYIPLHYS